MFHKALKDVDPLRRKRQALDPTTRTREAGTREMPRQRRGVNTPGLLSAGHCRSSLLKLVKHVLYRNAGMSRDGWYTMEKTGILVEEKGSEVPGHQLCSGWTEGSAFLEGSHQVGGEGERNRTD